MVSSNFYEYFELKEAHSVWVGTGSHWPGAYSSHSNRLGTRGSTVGRKSEDLCLGYVPPQGLHVFTPWILHPGPGKVSLRTRRVGI